jgi:hypothetical protein
MALFSLCLLLANPSQVPREEGPRKNPRSWQFGAAEDAVDQGQAQAHSALGRTVHDCGGDPNIHPPTEGQRQQHPHQHLEHQTVTSLLSDPRLRGCVHNVV